MPYNYVRTGRSYLYRCPLYSQRCTGRSGLSISAPVDDCILGHSRDRFIFHKRLGINWQFFLLPAHYSAIPLFMTKLRPIVICILDGWGHSDDPTHNAIMSAKKPHWDRLMHEHTHSLIKTCGLDVGLPEGVMGNSEVGHMNIGSGRIVMQDLPQINEAIKNNTLRDKKPLKDLIAKLQKSGGTCHLLGLASDGGVHAHIDHVIALSEILAEAKIPVALHLFSDGRDTSPKSSKKFIGKIEKSIAKLNNVKIATVSGRYYGMDRDNRWERVEKAYDTIVSAKGEKAKTALDAIENSHKKDVTDEFILPTVIGDYKGMKDSDGILMANFRADRARQILLALLDPKFDRFQNKKIKFSVAVGMVEYSETHSKLMQVIFQPQSLNNILGQIISEKGMKQLRIAETEKYAHVTFFFNGGREEPFPGEDRILVPSPKVATYDEKPEMSAPELTDKLVAAINSGKYDLIVVNYANTDMVGHTGDEKAAIKAVEAVDDAIGKLDRAVKNAGGALFITADHGNAELMVDPETGEIHTQHTLNEVPLILAFNGNDICLKDGRLSDIAPTVLQLMKIKQPAEMTGKSLIV